jgi:hypothetical protein
LEEKFIGEQAQFVAKYGVQRTKFEKADFDSQKNRNNVEESLPENAFEATGLFPFHFPSWP